jgi:preprotein translocase subunit SecF
MQLIKNDINLDFIGKRKIAFCLSLVLILVSVSSLVIHNGPRYGIDFAGGSLVQVKFFGPVTVDSIKTGLATVGLGDSSVQRFGDPEDNEYLIRTDASVASSEGFSKTLNEALPPGRIWR